MWSRRHRLKEELAINEMPAAAAAAAAGPPQKRGASLLIFSRRKKILVAPILAAALGALALWCALAARFEKTVRAAGGLQLTTINVKYCFVTNNLS